MKERPILFSGPMVQAILAGRKTQTRRIVKPQSAVLTDQMARGFGVRPPAVENAAVIPCPYGQVGDRLWVREAWALHPETGNLLYKADDGAPSDTRWRPSIHMPRKHSRLLLEVVGIKVERLQAISREDAQAEGTDNYPGTNCPIDKFFNYWCYLNGFDSWDANPWVWVVSFQHCKGEAS